MDVHYGQIVEKIVRRNSYSITELAALTKVNRRSVYNWFNQKRLSPGIIYKIGIALDYDFSIEMPELFSSDDFKKRSHDDKPPPLFYNGLANRDDDIIWKNKYIDLLEEFQALLALQLKTAQEDKDRKMQTIVE
ncbi:helix-turn-helix domain-containing protein [Mucilaginibacter sp. 21P]|nr:helix-turn-helix domain-containing protein [Mucilaginibacter sp. 21P]QXV67697.1 helix-turn-helix domain-containing protein [Mucilaginibacter sp. 21P]